MVRLRIIAWSCDAWSEDWNLAGAVQDIALFRDMGAELATSTRWPEWKDGSEFKQVREESADARGVR